MTVANRVATDAITELDEAGNYSVFYDQHLSIVHIDIVK